MWMSAPQLRYAIAMIEAMMLAVAELLVERARDGAARRRRRRSAGPGAPAGPRRAPRPRPHGPSRPRALRDRRAPRSSRGPPDVDRRALGSRPRASPCRRARSRDAAPEVRLLGGVEVHLGGRRDGPPPARGGAPVRARRKPRAPSRRLRAPRRASARGSRAPPRGPPAGTAGGGRAAERHVQVQTGIAERLRQRGELGQPSRRSPGRRSIASASSRAIEEVEPFLRGRGLRQPTSTTRSTSSGRGRRARPPRPARRTSRRPARRRPRARDGRGGASRAPARRRAGGRRSPRGSRRRAGASVSAANSRTCSCGKL